MGNGKKTCDVLKQVRLDIAHANGIDYHPAPCTHDGECLGTCPACENEVQHLEREIARMGAMGKAVLIAGVSLGLTGPAMAGSNVPEALPTPHNLMVEGDNEIFGSSAHMPSFPGGDAAMLRFLQNHIQYPAEAAKNKIEGKVIVQFVVQSNGKVGEIKVARSSGNEELDLEAVRVISLLPDFSPGRNAMGEPVNVWYTMPMVFKLPEESVSTETRVE